MVMTWLVEMALVVRATGGVAEEATVAVAVEPVASPRQKDGER